MFQEPRLLPWRSVAATSLPARAGAERAAASRWRALDLVGSDACSTSAQPARAGCASAPRSPAPGLQPRVLLLDEPFSALDALTRDRLNLEVLALWERAQPTIVIVTHSIPEAILLADRVVVMTPRPGRVAAIVPIDLPRPRSLDVLDRAVVSDAAAEIRGLLGGGALAA